MKLSNGVIGVLCAGAALATTAADARTVRVDGTVTCSSVVAATGSESIPLTGGGKRGAKADSGVNFPVLSCSSPGGTDSNGNPTPGLNPILTPLSYDPTSTALYAWVDLSSATDVTPASLLSPSSLLSSPPAPLGLSSFAELEVSIPAALYVLALTGSYGGYHEIIFNYESFPQSECGNVFKPITPSFTWYGKTYTFTGAGGVSSPCESSATSTTTNDFLFGPNGVLHGYNSAPDGSNTFTLTPGLPPGWSVRD